MSEPLVTIAIPCFNAEKYVGESIESALAQTYDPKEVVVADDASTDGSWDVISSYADRIRAIRLPCNVGNAAARNALLKESRGELLQFHDADDVMLPTKLETMVPILQATRADAVLCDVGFFRQSSETPDYDVVRYTELEDTSDLLAFAISNVVLTLSPVWRRKVVEAAGGFREDLRRCVDYDLTLRAARTGGNWLYIGTVLTRARVHSGNSVSSNKHRVRGTVFSLLRDLQRSLEEGRELSESRRQALALRFRGIGLGYFEDNRTARAALAFRYARRCYPGVWKSGTGSRALKLLAASFGYPAALRARNFVRGVLGLSETQSIWRVSE